jgi:transposase
LEGVAKRIDFEETCLLGYRKATHVRIVVARAKYKVEGLTGTELVTAEKPKELYERGMLAPSMIAHVLVKKVRFCMPFHRLAEELGSYGIERNDSTMCRYAEHIGSRKRRALGPSLTLARPKLEVGPFACQRTRPEWLCSLHRGLVNNREASGMCEGALFRGAGR